MSQNWPMLKMRNSGPGIAGRVLSCWPLQGSCFMRVFIYIYSFYHRHTYTYVCTYSADSGSIRVEQHQFRGRSEAPKTFGNRVALAHASTTQHDKR